MAEKIDSKTLYARAAELEGSLPEIRSAVSKAEEVLTDAYASGASTSAAQAALDKARSDLAGRIAVLSKLERRAYDAAMAEREQAIAKFQAESKAAYDGVVLALADAVETVISPILVKAGVSSGIVEEFTGGVKDVLWTGLLEKQAENVRSLGPAPHEPAPRGDDGLPVDMASVAPGNLAEAARQDRIVRAFRAAQGAAS